MSHLYEASVSQEQATRSPWNGWLSLSLMEKNHCDTPSRGRRSKWTGIGMENTCKPMAVSFQCMTKSTTNKKKKKPSGRGFAKCYPCPRARAVHCSLGRGDEDRDPEGLLSAEEQCCLFSDRLWPRAQMSWSSGITLALGQGKCPSWPPLAPDLAPFQWKQQRWVFRI